MEANNTHMTQKKFWAAIEARTSKEVADFGFSDIVEQDLPGVTRDEDADVITCADLDAAAATAREAYERFRGSDF